MTSELYVPRVHQAEIETGLARFSVLVCHRRFGKTVLSVNRLIRAARTTQRTDWRGAYIAPLYKQAKTVVWDELKRYCGLGLDGCTVRFNETELRADFDNGARIRLFGAENPDSLRGMYLDGAVFDEVAQMPHRVWTEVIRPALSDRMGWAMFIGTPRGKNALYRLWQDARRDPDWFAAMYRASQTGIIEPDELAAAAREMSPEEYEQEFECSFTAAIRGAYFSALMGETDKAGRITKVPHDPSLPVHTAWDLGMSDSTAIWFVQARPGNAFAVIDYYEASGEGLDHYARVLDERRYAYASHIAPHDIRVRELGTGKSRLEIARSLGIRFDIAPNIPIQDGINAVRTMLPLCWFDAARCAPGLEALRHYRRSFNERMGDFAARPVHDWTSHAVDAFRYFAVGFRQPGSGPRPPRTVNQYDPSGGTMSVRDLDRKPEAMAHFPDGPYRWLELHHQGEAYGHAALAERGSDLELHLTLIRWGPQTRRRLVGDAVWLRGEATRLGKSRILGLRACTAEAFDPKLFRFARLYGFGGAWVIQAAAMDVEPEKQALCS